MSRRDKKRAGNPSPQKSRSWLESREVEKTPARGKLAVDHEGAFYPVYPVNKRLRKFVDNELRS